MRDILCPPWGLDSWYQAEFQISSTEVVESLKKSRDKRNREQLKKDMAELEIRSLALEIIGKDYLSEAREGCIDIDGFTDWQKSLIHERISLNTLGILEQYPCLIIPGIPNKWIPELADNGESYVAAKIQNYILESIVPYNIGSLTGSSLNPSREEITLESYKKTAIFFGEIILVYFALLILLSFTGILHRGGLAYTLYGIGSFVSILWFFYNPLLMPYEKSKRIFKVKY